jgi:iron complex outermembrane receptor protein
VQGNGQSPPGPGVGYVATRSLTATKSDTPILETPQTISVVTRQQMDDQNAQSVPEALRYSSGVLPEQRGANSQGLEYVYNRGFQIDEYLNGLILPGSLDGYNVTSIDAYMLNRVELLQGPASVLYGQASPGGLLNLVSKAPTDTPYHEIMLQGGNYDHVQGAVDVSDKLNADGTLLGRITADAFNTNTQTQYIQQQRIAIAPSVTWRPDASTNLTVFANLQYDPEAGYYNNVTAVGTVLPGAVQIPRSLDPGDPSYDHFSKTEASIGYSFSHEFNPTWTVFQNFRYLYSDETIAYVGPYALTPDEKSFERYAYYNHGVVNALGLDNRAQAKFSTGPLNHTFIFGVDYYRTDYNHIFQLGAAPNLSIANPVYNQTIASPSLTLGTSGDQLVQQVGLYAQDQVRL